MQLDVFAHDLSLVLQESAEQYASIYDQVNRLARSEGGAVAEAELVRIRAAAGEIAERVAVSARYADKVKQDFGRPDVDPRHNPQPVRSLASSLVENFLILNRLKGLPEFASLPISTPEEIRGEMALPRVAAWFDYNLRFTPQPPAASQPPAPAPAPRAAEPVQPSPYPPIDPTDTSAHPEPLVPDPGVLSQRPEPPREEGWQSIDPPSDLPGDRHR